MIKNNNNDKGISEVVGELLLVVIIVLLAATFGVHMLSQAEQEGQPKASVLIDDDNPSFVEVKPTGFPRADEIYLQYPNGSQIPDTSLTNVSQSAKIKHQSFNVIARHGEKEQLIKRYRP